MTVFTSSYAHSDNRNVKKEAKIHLSGPEKAALWAVTWLAVISVLHFWLNGQPCPDAPEGDRGRQKTKVAFLPITCHLLLPVALERDSSFSSRVEAVKFSSWPDMIEAFKGGELDAAMILAPIAISMRAQGVPLRIALYGHRNGTALVMADSISGPEGLIGKSVAIPIRFSTQNLALLELLERRGINPESMDIVELPPPDMPSALAAGAIAAYIVGEPYAAQAELSGVGYRYCEADAIFEEFISSLLIVSERFLEQEPEKARWLIRTLYAQGAWIEGHRKEAAKIGARAYGLSERLLIHVLTSSSERVRYRNLIPKSEEIRALEEAMERRRLLSDKAPDPERIIYTGWMEEQEDRP